MTTGSTGTKRRTLLQRGIALLAGGAAIAGGTRWAAAASPLAESGGGGRSAKTLTLYARKRPVVGTAADGRLVASGDLFDRPGGERIGSFHSNCFCAQSPFTRRSPGEGGFGAHAAGAPSLEFHVLQLGDGTLFSVGNAGGDTVRPLAIIGGTEAFAGKSGTWIERAIAGEHATDDMRELTITFAG